MTGKKISARQQRSNKKSLPEIETATKAFYARWKVVVRKHNKLILTSDLPEAARVELFNSFQQIVCETIAAIGFKTKTLRVKSEHEDAKTARKGKSTKAAVWHEIANRLARELWKRRPGFGARSTREIIWTDFATECGCAGITTPKAGTVEKYISSLA